MHTNTKVDSVGSQYFMTSLDSFLVVHPHSYPHVAQRKDTEHIRICTPGLFLHCMHASGTNQLL